jgi:hypothetical protein
MKLLYLTSVLAVPNELGEQKIKEAIEVDGSHIDYESLGIRAPKGKPSIDQDGNIRLLEDEVDYTGMECILNLDEFSSCVDNEKLGSVIYTKDGGELWIFQEVDEVSDYIEFLSLNSFERWWIGFKIYVLSLFRQKQRIIENKID